MKKKILIADDDEGIRDIINIVFTNAGYSVEAKSDGADLLIDNYTIPDLFLIDKQLSSWDGLKICQHLKTSTKTKNIPVIMVSATPDIEQTSLLAGADGYIEKPFNIAEIIEKVGTHIGGSHK
jgi:DNA-binding response OmpR family regulator